jgi:hypothetical protein
MVYFFRPADATLEEQPIIADAKNTNYHLQLQHQQHQQQIRRQMSPSECDADTTPTNHRRGSSSPMLFGIDTAMKNLMRPRAQSASPTWAAEEETKNVVKSNVVEFSASNNTDSTITMAQKRAMELSAMYELSEQQEEDLNPTATFAKRTKTKKYILPSIKMTGGGGGGSTGVSNSMVSGLSAAKKAAQKFAKNQHRLAQSKTTTKATEVSTLSLDIGASPPPRKVSQTKKLSSDAPTSPIRRQHSRTLSSDSIGMYSAALHSMEEGEGQRDDVDHNDGRRDDNKNQDQRDDVAPGKPYLSVSMRKLVIGVCKPIQNSKTSTREDLSSGGETFHPSTDVPILYNLPSLC